MSNKILDEDRTSELWETIKNFVYDKTTVNIPIKAPIGCIVWWSGTADNVPTGWHICDGTNGTIDLRDKFILAAGPNHAVGETGGAEEVTLTVEQMPSHNHSENFVTTTISSNKITANPPYAIAPQSADGKALPTWTWNGFPYDSYSQHVGKSGSSQPHSNMPPYYTLCAIQKISADETDGPTFFTTDDTLTITDDNVLGVAVPNKPITKEEYDALTEEEKAGKFWLVDEPALTPTTISIQEYDTDGGWHIRKYSDGYVEMISTSTITMELSDWEENGAAFCKDTAFVAKNYPVALTVLYGSFPSLLANGHGYGAWVTPSNYVDNLLRTTGYAIWRFTKPNTVKTYTLNILVTGRWK